jgi:alkyl hydroperoxide reductase 1
LKGKDVDIIACIAYNDAYVMSAWGKVNGIKGGDIVCIFTFLFLPFPHSFKSQNTNHEINTQLFLSDSGTVFSQNLGWMKGERTARYALVIDDDGKIIYAAKEPGRDVSVSSAEAVLAQL